MISEEKMVHVVHLMLTGLDKAGMATFPHMDKALHEAKVVCFQFVKQWAKIGDVVRQRILSQKNAPPESSPQWETLYRKYYEEEVRKLGG